MNYYCYPGTISKRYIPANLTHEIRVQWANQIIKTVSIYYNVSIEDMFNKRRTLDLVRACQVATYLIKIKVVDLSLKQISSLFGNRYFGKTGHDHSVIVHNFAKINDLISIGDGIQKDIEQLLKLI